jgi:hypothetical protein
MKSFVDLKSDVARCPKHVLSDLGPETLLVSPCPRLFPDGDTHSLVDEWSRISQVEFQTLIRIFQNRCRKIIRARGGHTRY